MLMNPIKSIWMSMYNSAMNSEIASLRKNIGVTFTAWSGSAARVTRVKTTLIMKKVEPMRALAALLLSPIILLPG